MANEAAQKRLAEVAALQNVLPGSWPHLAAELGRLRERMVEGLIASNNEELRGKVKMIDELLRLPNTLDQESKDLAQSLSE